MAKLVAQTYGEALYELAVEENKVDELLEEVKGLRAAFSETDDLIRFMKHPQVTNDEKCRMMEDSLKGRISDDLLGFILVVTQKDRFSDILSILDYFIDAVKKLKGIGTAYVTTPMALTEIQKECTREKLLSTTGYKEIEVVYDIDASLIGGMIIRIGDRVVDSSVRSHLYELKRDLLSVQLKN